MNMNTALKKAIQNLFALCEDEEKIRKETVDFLSYLSASDGKISDYEAAFIKDYLSNDMTSSVSEAYIAVMECVGREFIVCDGKADDAEVCDYTTYTTMLRSYKKEDWQKYRYLIMWFFMEIQEPARPQLPVIRNLWPNLSIPIPALVQDFINILNLKIIMYRNSERYLNLSAINPVISS